MSPSPIPTNEVDHPEVYPEPLRASLDTMVIIAKNTVFTNEARRGSDITEVTRLESLQLNLVH